MFGNLTPVVKNLLIVNVVVLVIQQFLGFDFVDWFGLRYIFADTFRPYQFITHLFVHGSFWHLFGNMFALFIFGPMLERVWGSQRFLLFYLITGLGASVLYSAVNFYEIDQLEAAAEQVIENPSPDNFAELLLDHAEYAYPQLQGFVDQFYDNPNNSNFVSQSQQYASQLVERKENIPMVGASGAVFGILMAFGLLFPNTELFLLFFPFPIKAKYFVLFYGLYELWSGFERVPGDNVAHFAHLGGMLFAFILVKLWKDKRNVFY